MKVCFGSYIQKEGVDPMLFGAAFAKKLANGIRILTNEEVEVTHFVRRDDMTEALSGGGYDLIVTDCKLKPDGESDGSDSVGLGTIKKWLANGYARRVILIFGEDMHPVLKTENGKENWLVSGKKVVELWKKDYFDGIFLADMTAEKVVELYVNGRDRESAKAYYGITDGMLERKPPKPATEEQKEGVSSYYKEEAGETAISEEEPVVEKQQPGLDSQPDVVGKEFPIETENREGSESAVGTPEEGVSECAAVEKDNPNEGTLRDEALQMEISETDTPDGEIPGKGVLEDEALETDARNKEVLKTDAPAAGMEHPVSEAGGIESVEQMDELFETYFDKASHYTDEPFKESDVSKKEALPEQEEETKPLDGADMSFISGLSSMVDELFQEDVEYTQQNLFSKNVKGFDFSEDFLGREPSKPEGEAGGFQWQEDDGVSGSEIRSGIRYMERKEEEDSSLFTNEEEKLLEHYSPLFDSAFGRTEHIDEFNEKHRTMSDAEKWRAVYGSQGSAENNVIQIVAPKVRKQFSEPVEGFVDKITSSTTMMVETVGALYEAELCEYAITGVVDTGVTGRIVDGKYVSGAVVIDGFGVRWMSPTTLMIEVTNRNLISCKDTILKKPCSLVFSKISDNGKEE